MARYKKFGAGSSVFGVFPKKPAPNSEPPTPNFFYLFVVLDLILRVDNVFFFFVRFFFTRRSSLRALSA